MRYYICCDYHENIIHNKTWQQQQCRLMSFLLLQISPSHVINANGNICYAAPFLLQHLLFYIADMTFCMVDPSVWFVWFVSVLLGFWHGTIFLPTCATNHFLHTHTHHQKWHTQPTRNTQANTTLEYLKHTKTHTHTNIYENAHTLNPLYSNEYMKNNTTQTLLHV